MNQILYTASGKAGGPLPIKKVVRFFAICIIILGITFFGGGTYALFSYDFSSDSTIDDTIPEISFAKDRKYFECFYNS